MVRIEKQEPVVVGNFGYFYEMYGLSTDDKPTYDDMVTGSKFMEVDTGDVYAYNEAESDPDTAWCKICSLGGDS